MPARVDNNISPDLLRNRKSRRDNLLWVKRNYYFYIFLPVFFNIPKAKLVRTPTGSIDHIQLKKLTCKSDGFDNLACVGEIKHKDGTIVGM